ncbi:MAG: universal stress protein [Candidatus Magnetobacterium sp. LHC-1]|uniref:Universal stress protein n=1 Tax=Candidatus Magnetobacterium casense TaxID=1455061 RepID=A0ABS6RV16_9BACT|nr:universal stress protein [Candidatus Magnetobacterium casensis]MBF0607387.1 universal stress protein [Nitrospirota bacterium]MBV6340474.1 universal stress protein [Candidatus Magnetobacterium casensis]
MMQKIILCHDNSELSGACEEVTLQLARSFGCDVVGIHGFNSVMHDGAFRIMEPTLPQEYQKEEILQHQRAVHATLIKVGMEKISLSYLRPLEDDFKQAGVPFRPKVFEGKNFIAINEMIQQEGDGLIVIGAGGFNALQRGFVGSVCMRVLRSNDRDILVVKRPTQLKEPNIVVCLDGSACAINALKAAKAFAEKYSGNLHLVYAFDSSLHKDLFNRLKDSVINAEGFSFNSQQQEKIHDEFIDKGLERVGYMILDKAERDVFSGNSLSARFSEGWGLVPEDVQVAGVRVIKKVFAGYIYKSICDYAAEVNADMIFIGRTGRHYAEGVDLGSVTENVLRYAPCSVFITQKEQNKGWQI